MNGENLHVDLKGYAQKQIESLICFIKTFAQIVAQEKNRHAELEVLTEDLNKLKEIQNKLDEKGINPDDSLADAMKSLDPKDAQDLQEIFNSYTFLVCDAEKAEDAGVALFQAGIPYVTADMKLRDERGEKPKRVFMVNAGPDRDISKIKFYDSEIMKVVRHKNIFYFRQSEGHGIIPMGEFKSQFNGKHDFLKIPNVEQYMINLMGDTAAAAAKDATSIASPDKEGAYNLIIKDSDKGFFMGQLLATHMYDSTIINKYTMHNILQQRHLMAEISKTAAFIGDGASYICDNNNNYIKITSEGFEFYQNGVYMKEQSLKRNLVDANEFKKSLFKACSMLQYDKIVCLKESEFSENPKEREKAYKKAHTSFEFNTIDPAQAEQIRRQIEIRKPVEELLSKCNNLNYEAMLSENGLQYIIGLAAKASLYNQLSNNYEKTIEAIKGDPRIDINSIPPKGAPISQMANDAFNDLDVRLDEFLDLFLKNEDPSIKDKMKSNLINMFTPTKDGAQLSELLDMGAGIEKACIKTAKYAKETQELGNSIDNIIHKKTYEREDPEKKTREEEPTK